MKLPKKTPARVEALYRAKVAQLLLEAEQLCRAKGELRLGDIQDLRAKLDAL